MGRGINQKISLTALIIIIAAVSLTFNYWSGFLSEILTSKQERLLISSISYAGIDVPTSQEIYKITIRNVGTVEIRLEYLYVNGALVKYGSEVSGIFREHNVGEYRVIPRDSLVIVCFLYESGGHPQFEFKVHTLAGTDFTQTLTLLR